jgi:holin-like protein
VTAPSSLSARALLREALGIAVCCATFLGADALERRFPLPLPPGVVGALFLAALLASRLLPLSRVAPGADRLLRHLGLLFVPAAVLALRQRALVIPALLPLVVVIVASTAVGLVVGGVLTERLARADGSRPGDSDDSAAAREEEAGT